MSSRQEKKEQRRKERLEREAAEAKSAANKRRLQLVGGGVLGVAALVAVVVAVAVGGSDEPERPKGGDASREAAQSLPAQKVTDLGAAASAAGCKVTNAKYEGASHDADRSFTPADYKTNPPTSGEHNPNYYEDGIYEPGSTPKLGELVHTLEHGRIDVQYKAGTPTSVTAQLEAFVGENDGYHMLLFENTTEMPYAVAATAWTHMVGCDEMSPEVFDVLRTFRDRYIDKGPEKIP